MSRITRGSWVTFVQLIALFMLVEGIAIASHPTMTSWLIRLDPYGCMCNPTFTVFGSVDTDVKIGLGMVAWGTRWTVVPLIYYAWRKRRSARPVRS